MRKKVVGVEGSKVRTQILGIKSKGEFLSSPMWHLSDDDPTLKACVLEGN